MNSHISRAPAVYIALALSAAAGFEPSTASAGIIQTTGAAQIATTPTSAEQNTWEHNHRVRVFQESLNITLDRDIAVDFLAPGHYRNSPALNRGLVAEGTNVNSYLLHQDGKSNDLMRLAGSVRFDEVIVGVIVKKFRINETDGLLGSTTTTYESLIDLGRGLEMSRGRDEIRLSSDMKRITFNLLTSDAMDEIRVITLGQAVPSPGSLALIGLAGLVGLRGRRRT